MKRILWAVIGAVVFSGCTCGEKSAPDAGVPDAGVAAAPPQVTDTVKLIREADADFQAGKLDDAIAKSEAALRQAPTQALALNILGRSAAAKFAQSHDPKDAAKARDAFSRAYQANPGFWPALLNLAELAEKEGKLDEAAGFYQKVLIAEPNHPDKGRFEKLIEAARRDAGR